MDGGTNVTHQQQLLKKKIRFFFWQLKKKKKFLYTFLACISVTEYRVTFWALMKLPPRPNPRGGYYIIA